MKKKKSLILVGLLIVLMICLTGCGTKEIIIKNVEKDEEIAKIELNVNKDALKEELKENEDASKEELKENEDALKEEAKANKDILKEELNNSTDSNIVKEKNFIQEENNKNVTNEKFSEKEVVRVDFSDISAESRYLIIYGYDKNANIVWQYKTPVEVSVPQFTNLEYIGEYDHELVYLNEFGTIKALDFQTGEVLFSNNEYQDGESRSLIDANGDLYLCGTYKSEDFVFIMNKEGKTVKKIDVSKYIDEEQVPYDVDLVINDDSHLDKKAGELCIRYEGDSEDNMVEITTLLINLDTYECKVNEKSWQEYNRKEYLVNY
ncbi:MAG: hypothetical protein J6J60_08875 [Clostridia bacterium]|nr:hypothetical protein [Clostridia bacterium]